MTCAESTAAGGDKRAPSRMARASDRADLLRIKRVDVDRFTVCSFYREWNNDSAIGFLVVRPVWVEVLLPNTNIVYLINKEGERTRLPFLLLADVDSLTTAQKG